MVESQNPHRWPRSASRLSRKVTGEVRVGRLRPKNLRQKGVLAILRFHFTKVQGLALPKEA